MTAGMPGQMDGLHLYAAEIEYKAVGKTNRIRARCVVKGFETDTDGEQLLDVQFPTERLYTFASHCQPYRKWLDENGF